MANPWASEVEICLNSIPHKAKLTLGALAELEQALGQSSLIDLITRLESGTMSGGDLIALIAAGLRGGGWQGSAQDLLTVDIASSPIEAAHLAALLVTRAFSLPTDSPHAQA